MEAGGGAGAGGGAADGGKSSKLPQMAPLTKYKLVFLGDQVRASSRHRVCGLPACLEQLPVPGGGNADAGVAVV